MDTYSDSLGGWATLTGIITWVCLGTLTEPNCGCATSRVFREVASTAIVEQSLSSPLGSVRGHRANFIRSLLGGHAAQSKVLLQRRTLAFHYVQLL
jgi:hypothetical protein